MIRPKVEEESQVLFYKKNREYYDERVCVKRKLL
jgi:hypothetical protein